MDVPSSHHNYAKSTWGLMTRLAAKVTAHSVGMMVNSLLGRPALKLVIIPITLQYVGLIKLQ